VHCKFKFVFIAIGQVDCPNQNLSCRFKRRILFLKYAVLIEIVS